MTCQSMRLTDLVAVMMTEQHDVDDDVAQLMFNSKRHVCVCTVYLLVDTVCIRTVDHDDH